MEVERERERGNDVERTEGLFPPSSTVEIFLIVHDSLGLAVTSEPYSCTTLLLMNGILYQKKKIDKKKQEGSRDLLRQEFRQHDAGGAHPEWAQKLVNDAVHVVERQGVEDDVIFGPRPL